MNAYGTSLAGIPANKARLRGTLIPETSCTSPAHDRRASSRCSRRGRDRRVHRRAGGSERAASTRRPTATSPGRAAVPPARRPAHRRRGDHGLRPDRALFGEPALRVPARHGHVREGRHRRATSRWAACSSAGGCGRRSGTGRPGTILRHGYTYSGHAGAAPRPWPTSTSSSARRWWTACGAGAGARDRARAAGRASGRRRGPRRGAHGGVDFSDEALAADPGSWRPWCGARARGPDATLPRPRSRSRRRSSSTRPRSRP